MLRDVGRVLQMPYGQVDRLCKLVPNNPANPVTLPEAIAGEPKLQEARRRRSDGRAARSRSRRSSKASTATPRRTPPASSSATGRWSSWCRSTRDPKSNTPVTQFNWKLVEAAGLVKFDFLGLKTLTVLQKAVDLVKRGRGIDIDLATLPLDDTQDATSCSPRRTRSACSSSKSTGMRESLKRLKPDRFEDIIAMVALYRPGPMDNIPTYINRKHGEEPVDCLHPLLEGDPQGDLRRHHLPGAGDADRPGDGRLLARRRPTSCAAPWARKTRPRWPSSRRASSTAPCRRASKKDDAAYIFELVDKFAGYGFNKSHAAAYALVSYHTAYLKANYREEFLAASMTLDMGNTDKLAHVRRRGAQAAASRCCRRASTPPRSISSPSRRRKPARRAPSAIRSPP